LVTVREPRGVDDLRAPALRSAEVMAARGASANHRANCPQVSDGNYPPIIARWAG